MLGHILRRDSPLRPLRTTCWCKSGIHWNWMKLGYCGCVCVCVDRCLNFHMLWPEEKIELERALQKQRFEQWVVRHVSAWSVSCEVITPQPIACAKRWHCKTGNTEKCACMQMRRCRRLHCKESETDRQTDWQTDRLTDWERERGKRLAAAHHYSPPGTHPCCGS